MAFITAQHSVPLKDANGSVTGFQTQTIRYDDSNDAYGVPQVGTANRPKALQAYAPWARKYEVISIP